MDAQRYVGLAGRTRRRSADTGGVVWTRLPVRSIPTYLRVGTEPSAAQCRVADGRTPVTIMTSCYSLPPSLPPQHRRTCHGKLSLSCGDRPSLFAPASLANASERFLESSRTSRGGPPPVQSQFPFLLGFLPNAGINLAQAPWLWRFRARGRHAHDEGAEKGERRALLRDTALFYKPRRPRGCRGMPSVQIDKAPGMENGVTRRQTRQTGRRERQTGDRGSERRRTPSGDVVGFPLAPPSRSTPYSHLGLGVAAGEPVRSRGVVHTD